MKRAVLFLLICSAMAWGQKTRYGQANYTNISVQVESSRLVNVCETQAQGVACGFAQQLTVLVNRKEMTIVGDGFTKALLKPGMYHGKIAQQPEGKSYESARKIELQFPDGKTRSYIVAGGDQ
jgi:hypothetical protein